MDEKKSRKQSKQNLVSPEHYLLPKISKWKLTGLVFAIFIVGFTTSFPFQEKLDGLVQDKLNSIPNCSISYKNLKLEYFFPQIVINNAVIPPGCFKQRNTSNLFIDSLSIKLNGLSFSPFGLSSIMTIKIGQSEINIEQATSVSDQRIAIRNTNIHTGSLIPMLTNAFKIEGDLDSQVSFELKNNKVSTADLLLQSTDFKIPPQPIAMFTLPTKLKVDILKIKAQLDSSSKLHLAYLLLGNERSPIRAKFTGNIYVIQSNLGNSTLDLKGEISFSNEFLAIPGLSILKTLLAAFDKKDGFYQIKVGGRLSSPVPSPI